MPVIELQAAGRECRAHRAQCRIHRAHPHQAQAVGHPLGWSLSARVEDFQEKYQQNAACPDSFINRTGSRGWGRWREHCESALLGL